jgi:hypothetical protein
MPGGNLAAVKEILVHCSIVTMQRYARLSDDAVCAERCGNEPDHLPGHPTPNESQGNVASPSLQYRWAVSSGRRAPAF